MSGAGVCNMPMVVATATGAVAKMVACADPPLRDKAIGMADVHAYGGWIFNGINQHGQFFMAMHSGMAPGALPASTSRDGVDTGGIFWVPGMEASNVEDNEMAWPVLTLYRRQNRANAAGAGRYRSGVAAEEAWVLHGTDTARYADLQQRELREVPGPAGRQSGRPGLLPAQAGQRRPRPPSRRDTSPRAWTMSPARRCRSTGRARPSSSTQTSVWTHQPTQLRRLRRPARQGPGAVARDLSDGKMTAAEAFEVYGVIAGETGEVDAGEDSGRTGQVQASAAGPGRPGPGSAVMRSRVADQRQPQPRPDGGRCALRVRVRPATWRPATPTSRDGCVVKESPVDAIGPGYTSFATEMMQKMCFREFFCPACGARLATEVARVGDDYLWDIELRHVGAPSGPNGRYDAKERETAMLLEDRVAIVTGGAKGMGRAMCERFAKEGAKVTIADIDMPEAEETLRLVEAAGGEGLVVKCDVTSAEQVKDMVAATVAAFGKIDILVNNAGAVVGAHGKPTNLAVLSEDAWDRVVDLNLKGVFLCSKEVVPT